MEFGIGLIVFIIADCVYRGLTTPYTPPVRITNADELLKGIYEKDGME